MSSVYTESVCVCHAPLQEVVVLGCLYFATGVTIGVIQSAFIIAPYVLFQVHTVSTAVRKKEAIQ